MATRLSPNFTLQELVFSQTAARHGIANQPDPAQVRNLTELCVHILEPLRARVAQPLRITSGFRAPLLNRAIGGAAGSQHLEGKAADVVAFPLSTRILFREAIGARLPFDQIIFEGGRHSQWVHVSFDAERQRGQMLAATFPPGGGVKYTRLTRAQALAW